MKMVDAVVWAKEASSRKSVPSNSTNGNEFNVEDETTGLSAAEDCATSLSSPEMSFHLEILPVSKIMDAESFALSQSKRSPRQTGVKEL
jgi:hypothetical protein